MSNRVTNIEIEDVLSSIRRLVSSEEREPRAKTHEDEPDSSESDKLVLTPSQRINFEDDSAEMASTVSYADSENLPMDGRGVLEEEIFESSEAEISNSQGNDPVQEFRSGRHLEARIAEVEEVVAQQEGEWEPDGATEDAYAGNLISPLPWTIESDPVADHVEIVEDPEESEQEIEEAVERHEQTAIEGDVEADEFSWLLEEVKIDEAALRDIVTEIVRQELQGALGERITRNVRKLVRREIQRALLAHRLD